MIVETHLITAEELAQMPEEEGGIELVKGEVIKMSPAGYKLGEIAASILIFIGHFVRQRKLGKVYTAETGFILARNPDTVRAPDAAFVTTERVAQQRRSKGYFDGPPNLAVEVVSPDDTDEKVEEKILDYVQAGTKMVWVIRPRTQTITVYRSLSEIRVLTAADTLDGGDILPGFTVPVKEIFE
jgi:Uma2 family endonuclease